MNNKKAKRLMADVCLRVSDNGEVSWMTSFSMKAAGSTLIYSDYLGGLDDCKFNVSDRCKALNFPKSEMKTAY